jgi:hypothetical protein
MTVAPNKNRYPNSRQKKKRAFISLLEVKCGKCQLEELDVEVTQTFSPLQTPAAQSTSQTPLTPMTEISPSGVPPILQAAPVSMTQVSSVPEPQALSTFESLHFVDVQEQQALDFCSALANVQLGSEHEYFGHVKF